MKRIAYYITAHGYGHGTRSCDILNALHASAPDVPITVKTDLPEDFIRNRLWENVAICAGAFDVGLIQKDSVHVDLNASIDAIEQLYSHEQELLTREMGFLEKENVGVVISDIPAIPLAAAQELGLPNMACSNFGWDWIYSEFIDHDPRWKLYVEKFKTVYEKTDLLLRQPFAEPMSAFSNQIDLPLLAKPGTEQRTRIAELTGADPAKNWVLLSFTTLNLDPQALETISRLSGHEVFAVEPLQWPGSVIKSINREDVSFSGVLASVDAVITKPGFGIVSECIANHKPILYTERENFREYPILVEAIKRFCRQAFISNSALYSGNLEQALNEIRTSPSPVEEIETGGAELAAHHILKAISAI